MLSAEPPPGVSCWQSGARLDELRARRWGGAVGLDVGTSEVLSNSEGCLLQSCGCTGGWLDEFL